MIYFHWTVTWTAFLLPVFMLGAVLSAAGLGLILSALNVSFRDIKYAVPFLIQMGIFVTPVIYPSNYIPARYQWLMGINPMAGVVTGFRHALLGSSISWTLVGISLGMSVLLFLSGLMIFRRMERRFADVI
jgi:lipopolysaccharide transport system permease protein